MYQRGKVILVIKVPPKTFDSAETTKPDTFGLFYAPNLSD
ncbi:hypothetical protein CFBP1573P_03037 [Pseudomonas syringae pv. persicae]|uniref:Uncharacterized protein n=1 Tax=Pseudomonas syringae pv. persicae TaxID=237306 RepID=A0AB38EJ50_9PSED|nr:hypothetical protein CFBP1573P_03037 [Pseudomonas syringae pv. persicae]SOQ11883.1 hypothetical protein NCPPB2254_03595 [Pseudomonas syringae pv. persicae]